MLLNLNLTCACAPRLIARPATSSRSSPSLRADDALLGCAQLLRAHEHAGPARRRPAGHRPARLVHVPVERDAAHAHLPRERHCLHRCRVVADQRVAEHKCDRFGYLVWVADERERRPHSRQAITHLAELSSHPDASRAASSSLIVPSLISACVRSLVTTFSSSLASSSMRMTLPPFFSSRSRCA